MIIVYLYLLFVGVQCIYALFFIWHMYHLPSFSILPPDERRCVSVIICAHNEAENLQANLSSVLQLDYCNSQGVPLYEVVVVNDRSTDESTTVLQALQTQYGHLKVVTTQDTAGVKGKKNALKAGLDAARYDWLLLTDADCKPASVHWLSLMTAPLVVGKEIVAGYSGYYPTPTLLNVFIRSETLHTFIQYSSYALAGRPYMAVGRNMACTRGALQKAMQDPIWQSLPSGDDDLLIRVSGTTTNTAIVSDQKAFTHSAAKETWSQWLHQKQRHMSTGKYYKPGVQLLLGLYASSHAIVCLGSFCLLLYIQNIWLAIFLAVTALLHMAAWVRAAKVTGEKKIGKSFILFHLGWIVYNFALLPYIIWKNKKNWK